MKVLVDAFGGDNAPVEIIKGAIMAINENAELVIQLFGNEDIIKEELAKYQYNKNQIIITDAKEVITNNEHPVEAVKTKKDSSLVKAVESLRVDDEAIGFVSAGSTGAVLTCGVLKLGRLKGVKRPALAPLFPTKIPGKNVLVIDCGANMDSDEINLLQFAKIGSAYMESVNKIEKPRIALLSVGVEDEKGNALTKKAFELLKQSNLNFVGNMESREALSGDYDVIVTDAFAGNVLIKSIEGTAEMLVGMLKTAFKKNFKSKMGYVFAKDSIKEVLSVLDYNKKGGAPFLGLKKIIVKSHGSSKATSIKASIFQVVDFYKAKLVENIEKAVVEE